MKISLYCVVHWFYWGLFMYKSYVLFIACNNPCSLGFLHHCIENTNNENSADIKDMLAKSRNWITGAPNPQTKQKLWHGGEMVEELATFTWSKHIDTHTCSFVGQFLQKSIKFSITSTFILLNVSQFYHFGPH